MSEIVPILIGKGGIQLGNTYHELFCKENNLGSDGTKIGEQSVNIERFASQEKNEKYTSRSILIDSESNITDQIKSGSQRSFYDNLNIISGIGDNFYQIPNGQNNIFLNNCLQQIRLAIEKCNSFQGFQIFHSIGGSTGSGFTSHLTQNLKDFYPLKNIQAFSMFESSEEVNSDLELCNTMLGIDSALESINQVFVFDNKKITNTLKMLDIDNPQNRDINKIISYNISPICQSLQYGSQNMEELNLNLVVYPKFHFFGTCLSPLIHQEKCCKMIGIEDILKYCFQYESNMYSKKLSDNKYLALQLIFSGDVQTNYAYQAVSSLRRQRTFKFVDWVPQAIRSSFNFDKLIYFEDCYLFKNNQNLLSIQNSSAITEFFEDFSDSFDNLILNKKIVQKYTEHGIEEMELLRVQNNINELLYDYQEAFETSNIEETINNQNYIKG